MLLETLHRRYYSRQFYLSYEDSRLTASSQSRHMIFIPDGTLRAMLKISGKPFFKYSA